MKTITIEIDWDNLAVIIVAEDDNSKRIDVIPVKNEKEMEEVEKFIKEVML